MTKITFIQHAHNKKRAEYIEMDVITNRVKELESYIKQAKEYIEEKEKETKIIRNKIEKGIIPTPRELFTLSKNENSVKELITVIKKGEQELLQHNLRK